ncbi:MAG TPA: hypothetical protein VMZ28_09045 [Kofleriaceae bacterium]|nr:hypothetical protein [Kofleriaceae bacterium]
MRNLILSCLFGALAIGLWQHTAEAGRSAKRGVKLVAMKQRNSVNPAAPDGTIVVKARFTGPNALARVGVFVAEANQGYSTGSKHGGVIAKMKTKRDGSVQVKAIALPQVKGQFLGHLAELVEQP